MLHRVSSNEWIALSTGSWTTKLLASEHSTSLSEFGVRSGDLMGLKNSVPNLGLKTIS